MVRPSSTILYIDSLTYDLTLNGQIKGHIIIHMGRAVLLLDGLRQFTYKIYISSPCSWQMFDVSLVSESPVTTDEGKGFSHSDEL